MHCEKNGILSTSSTLQATPIHSWSQRFGDGSLQSGTSVSVGGQLRIVVTGELNGTADFGGGPLTSAGGQDVFSVEFFDQDLVPVLFSSFEATLRGTDVEIRWDVQSDEALESFALYRRENERAQGTVIAEGFYTGTTRIGAGRSPP